MGRGQIRWGILAGVAIALVLTSCSRAPAANDAAKSVSGQAVYAENLYRANCAGCHDKSVGGAPNRAALERRTPADIRAALNDGVMKAQGSALTPIDRGVLAEYLGKAKPSQALAGKRCTGQLAFSGPPLWNRWGNGATNQRIQSLAAGGIDAAALPRLELAWSFGMPDAQRMRSQPAVTKEAIFIGSQSGQVYALNPVDGCIWWSYDAGTEVRGAPLIGTDAAGKPDRLYFADFGATIHALDARTGRKRWTRLVKDHPDGTITGSLALHAGRLFVPMSSTEIVSAYDPSYKCCSFRGGVAALAATDGKPLWRWYSTDMPTPAGTSRKGVPNLAPSGAPVWSTPTIDAKRGLLYVGTGENYSSPANGNSDAIIALSMSDGKLRWVRQTVAGDAWNAACGKDPGANCPAQDGPDFDFGAPPILITLASGKDMLLAGQKSGEIFGLDPDGGGAILWRKRIAMGGFNGGIHWGMASDGKTLYVGIADTPGSKYAKGPPRPGLHAFDAATGAELWSRIEPLACAKPSYECMTALSAPITAIPGAIIAGALNGKLTAYSTTDGQVLWRQETNRAFPTINGVEAKGGSIDSAGPVVAGGMLIVNSGYDKFGEIGGNVLLVYRLKLAGVQR